MFSLIIHAILSSANVLTIIQILSCLSKVLSFISSKSQSTEFLDECKYWILLLGMYDVIFIYSQKVSEWRLPGGQQYVLLVTVSLDQHIALPICAGSKGFTQSSLTSFRHSNQLIFFRYRIHIHMRANRDHLLYLLIQMLPRVNDKFQYKTYACDIIEVM